MSKKILKEQIIDMDHEYCNYFLSVILGQFTTHVQNISNLIGCIVEYYNISSIHNFMSTKLIISFGKFNDITVNLHIQQNCIYLMNDTGKYSGMHIPITNNDPNDNILECISLLKCYSSFMKSDLT